MGKCWNCGKYVTLNKFETKCDECKKIINYQCWNCKNWFSIYDEQTKEKLKECGICGFFVCPSCGSCGNDCEKDLWQIEIMKILSPEINYNKYSNLQSKINKLLSFIESIKISHEKKQCPNGVPITYAKGRIKTCIARMKGFRNRNIQDKLKFNKRVEEIMDIPLGTQKTINQSREDGSYGQEYRDVFNYLICLGMLQKQKIIKNYDGEDKEIEVYRRVENGACPHLDIENLLIKICPKCKKQYALNSNEEYCNCYIYTKGKNKGFSPKLKIKVSNKDTCQLNRGLFVKDGESEHS